MAGQYRTAGATEYSFKREFPSRIAPHPTIFERCQTRLKVVVAIPALNEEFAIAKVVVRSKPYADTVLVVDDGSVDDTGLIAQSLGAVVLKHERNLGKGAAIRDCFEWAKRNNADVLVTLDGDGQHDPCHIPVLLKVLETDGADIVIGSRSSRPQNMSRFRWLGTRALNRATQVKVGDRVADSQSGYRAYSRRAIETLVAAEFGMGVDSEMVIRAQQAGMRIFEAPVEMSYDGPKTSNQNPTMHALGVMFSVIKFVSIRHPLLFYGGFAFLFFANSMIFAFMTLDYYQKFGRVVTNLALISIASGLLAFLALFTGIILFTLITVIRERQ
jgi:glycosyltransferase involved in cell wall biosynthesis